MIPTLYAGFEPRNKERIGQNNYRQRRIHERRKYFENSIWVIFVEIILARIKGPPTHFAFADTIGNAMPQLASEF